MNRKNDHEQVPHILSKLRQEQRIENTPIRAFEMWIQEQERLALEMFETEDRRRKELADNGQDWSEADERSDVGLKVVKACGDTLKHIAAFKVVLAHEQKSRP